MERNLSLMSLVNVLIDEGIRFHTLQPLMAVMMTKIKPIHVVIPIRVKGYSFGESDYHSYVRERGRLLSSPRVRAALLEGRIVGQIAKEHLGHDHAALGPSAAVIATDFPLQIHWVPHIGTTSSQIRRSEIYAVRITATLVKNSLYFHPSFIYTFTGSGSQMSEVSWWPTPTHWNNHNANGFNWGSTTNKGYTVGHSNLAKQMVV